MLLSVLMLSCKKGVITEKEDIHRKTFASDLQVIRQGKVYEGKVSRDDTDSLKLSVWGESLKAPIEYEISMEGYKVSTCGLELSFAASDMQPQSVAAEIYSTFKMLPAAEVTDDGETVVYNVPTAKLIYDRMNKVFVSLETQNGSVIFENLSFNGG